MENHFKKGDRVRCIDDSHVKWRIRKGRIYTCLEDSSFDAGRIMWVVNIGECFNEIRFELVEPNEISVESQPIKFDYFNPKIDYIQITKDVCKSGG